MTHDDGFVPSSSAAPTGKQLLRAVWQLLREDRDLLWLPVLATISGIVAFAIVFGGGFGVGWAANGTETGVIVGVVLGTFVSTAIAIYFQAALVIGANQRADGHDPTLSGVLASAWEIKVRILKWAVVSTTVGLIIRQLEQRLGILGKIVGVLGGVAWAIATFFVVPVLVAQDLGPIEAVQSSSAVIQRTWGTSVRSTLRFGAIQLLALIPVIIVGAVGIALVTSGSAAAVVVGVLLLALAVAAVLAMSMLASAVTGYARALIYRYANGQNVPGIEPTLLRGAFAPRKRRGRLA